MVNLAFPQRTLDSQWLYLGWRVLSPISGNMFLKLPLQKGSTLSSGTCRKAVNIGIASKCSGLRSVLVHASTCHCHCAAAPPQLIFDPFRFCVLASCVACLLNGHVNKCLFTTSPKVLTTYQKEMVPSRPDFVVW